MKKGLLIIVLLVLLISLSGCTVTIGETELSGINVIWAPVVWVWQWLWGSFTPGFWTFLSNVWDMPISIVWLAGPIAYILGGVLFVAICILIVLADIVLAIAIGLLFFILSILNGIFHFQ